MLVIFFHNLVPFTTPFMFWSLYAAQSSAVADRICLIVGYVMIPPFIFASGFLLARARAVKTETFREAVYNRAKRLLLPWLLTVLLLSFAFTTGIVWASHVVGHFRDAWMKQETFR